MSERVDELVLAIANQPANLSLRLDLADALKKSRQSKIASWMRSSLAQANAISDIEYTFPTNSVWNTIRFSSFIEPAGPDPIDQWDLVKPSYWETPQHCTYRDYYGRWIFECSATSYPADRTAIDELSSATWLTRLWRDGLLEIIEYGIGASETAEWLFDLPDEILHLPFLLNTARSVGPIPAGLCRQLLSLANLKGLYLTMGIFAKGIQSELPERAPDLQFLNLDFSRRSSELDAAFESLKHFHQLRLLSVLGEGKLSAENIDCIARSTSIRALGIHSLHVERQQLFKLGAVESLKCLGINSSKLKRKDLQDFQTEFKGIKLLLSEDMQNRIGPA